MKTRILFLFVACLSALLLFTHACTTSKNILANWNHEFENGPFPWTHSQFDDAEDRFSFAVISDLYGGYREGIVDVAIEQINLLRPELVLSIGDLIDGGTEDIAVLKKEWDTFDSKASLLRAPFFHVGGNHDLTNTTMRRVWEERYGKRYYHFIYKNVLFLVLDSEDYAEERMQEIYVARAEAIKILDGDQPELAVHSAYFKMPERRTGEISRNQSSYFEQIIRNNPQVSWTFLMMHKPVWMREDQGGLEVLESALSGRPYTVINGHFHTYNYTEKNGQDYITMGTTGGSQNDKSKMAFDHFMWVTIDVNGTSIANFKLPGVLDKKGTIPAGGDQLCFQASLCKD